MRIKPDISRIMEEDDSSDAHLYVNASVRVSEILNSTDNPEYYFPPAPPASSDGLADDVVDEEDVSGDEDDEAIGENRTEVRGVDVELGLEGASGGNVAAAMETRPPFVTWAKKGRGRGEGMNDLEDSGAGLDDVEEVGASVGVFVGETAGAGDDGSARIGEFTGEDDGGIAWGAAADDDTDAVVDVVGGENGAKIRWSKPKHIQRLVKIIFVQFS